MKTEEKNKKAEWSEYFQDGGAGLSQEEEITESFEEQWNNKTKYPSFPGNEWELTQDELNDIRKFFITGNRNSDSENSVEMLHATSLQNFQYPQSTHSYPLWVADPAVGAHSLFGQSASLLSILSQSVGKIPINPKTFQVIRAKLLDKTRHWAESDKNSDLIQFSMVRDYLSHIPKELGMKGNDLSDLQHQLDDMLKNIPENGWLLIYSENIEKILVRLGFYWHYETCQKPYIRSVKATISHLEEILGQQGTSDKDPSDQFKSSLGKFGDFFNMDSLTSSLPDSAAQSLSDVRVKRIETQLAELKEHITLLEEKGTMIDGYEENSRELYGLETIKLDSEEPKEQVVRLFQDRTNEFVKLIKAYRIASLEEQNRYDENIYDPFFETMGWDDLDEYEKSLMPPVALRLPASVVENKLLSDLLHWINQKLTLRVFVFEDRPYLPGQEQFYELGMLLSASRNAYVCQSTGWFGDQLFSHIQDGLLSAETAIFYFLDSSSEHDLNSEVALFSRVFPHFTYSGKKIKEWGARFHIEGNPSSNKNWVSVALPVKRNANVDTLSMEITPVDYVFGSGAMNHLFFTLSKGATSNALVSVSEFMKLSEEEKMKRIPFLWAKDENEIIRKVVPHRSVISGAEDRKDFWETLLDLSGKKGYHKAKLEAELKKGFEAEKAVELEKINAQHQTELAEAEQKSMEEAMDRLTSALLDIDLENMTTGATPARSTAVSAEKPAATEEETDNSAQEPSKEELEEEQKEEVIDPYIDSALCTSCNECIQINKSMFKYNGDKLAYIANPDAGTFADLVEAASQCPAGIIHPGKPRNADEPGLDELLKEAEKYN